MEIIFQYEWSKIRETEIHFARFKENYIKQKQVSITVFMLHQNWQKNVWFLSNIRINACQRFLFV